MTYRRAAAMTCMTVMLANGCIGGRQDPTKGRMDGAVAMDSLSGTWEIALTLTTPGSAARTKVDPGAQITGMIALIPNQWPVRGLQEVSPSHYGLYMINFQRLGLDPRVPGELPIVAVESLPMDSLGIELQPGGADRGSVYLLGRSEGGTVVGRWIEQQHCCGSSGTFVMRRRAATGEH
jgi:hypothetical protein